MKCKNAFCFMIVIMCTFLFSIFCRLEVRAEEKVVKIGYIDYGSFIEKEKDGSYSGYGVEYLREISMYTGWKYEYVYDTWENCLDMLRRGEIDFVGTAQKTPAREKQYEFAELQNGVEQLVLYTTFDNDQIYYNDFKALDGKRVGLLSGSFQTEYFKNLSEKYDFKYIPYILKTEDDMIKALENGDVDVILTGSLAAHNDLKVIAKIGADPFYFMTFKGNDEMLEKLNKAMKEIRDAKPYFSEELEKEYYGSTVASTQPLYTREEVEYIQNAPAINVGCYSEFYPLSKYDKESKQFSGIIIDILDNISNKSGLKFEYVPVNNYDNVEDILRSGKIDIMSANVILNTTSQQYLNLSDCILDSEVVIVGREGETYDSKEKCKIAITSAFGEADEIVSKYFENYTTLNKDSVDDCLNAVLNGEADIYIDNEYMMGYKLNSPFYDSLQIFRGYSFSEKLCISCLQGENYLLMKVLNKTINSLDSNVVRNFISKHTQISNYEYTFSESIIKYKTPIILIVVIFVIIILFFVIMLSYKNSYLRDMEEKNRQLMVANNVRSSFLSNMSHEIRTPLNGIKGILDILSEKWKNEEDYDLLNMANQSSNHLMNLVNDILDMSKIESGKFELNKEYLNVWDFISYLDAIILPIAADKNITIEKNIPPCACKYILVDVNRLKQICINLLANSIKYTDYGGIVKIGIYSEKEGGFLNVKIVVEDNGIGMSKEFLEHAQEAFVQERTSNTQTGSGLGLAITKDLIELMGGTLLLESELGVGTKATICFTVEGRDDLEFQIDKIINESKKLESEVSLKDKHVLVVEDNEINMQIATLQLESFGIIAEKAVNGKEAVKMFENSKVGYYEIIFMDIMMPVMDGYEATRLIRSMNREDATSTPIVAITANAFAEDIIKTLESGMDYHLSKPFSKSDMKKVIYDIINFKENLDKIKGKYS